MNCRFSFKQIKKSDVLIEFAQPKILAKIEKYSTKPTDAHITFSKQGFNFIARCHATGGDGFNCQVESTSQDIYSAIDAMLAKLEVQLKKQKEKLKRHKFPEQQTLRHLYLVNGQDTLSEDWDMVPMDADDVIKFEKARQEHERVQRAQQRHMKRARVS